jgi:hypothetical protein
MESIVALTKWAAAFHFTASSKKGISAHHLMRQLGIGSYRTTWFLAYGIREVMTTVKTEPMGAWTKSTRRSSAQKKRQALRRRTVAR